MAKFIVVYMTIWTGTYVAIGSQTRPNYPLLHPPHKTHLSVWRRWPSSRARSCLCAPVPQKILERHISAPRDQILPGPKFFDASDAGARSRHALQPCVDQASEFYTKTVTAP